MSTSVTERSASLIPRFALHAAPPACPLTDCIHNLFLSKMKNQACAGEYSSPPTTTLYNRPAT